MIPIDAVDLAVILRRYVLRMKRCRSGCMMHLLVMVALFIAHTADAVSGDWAM